MNTGQMLLTVAAMMLLSVVVLRVNNNFLSTSSTLLDTKFGVLATSIATSMIEEASGKPFDLATVDNSVTSLSYLSTCGPAYGEIYPNFNDFDDFNGLVKIDSTMPSAIFKVECEVGYITPSNPNNIVGYKTWHKKMTVQVTSPSMEDTVRMSTVYSYFYYR